MNTVRKFYERNLKLFFRDKTTVFFSLLSVFIVIGLYFFFIGDMMTKNVAGSVKAFGVNAKFIVTSWIVAGLMTVVGVTSSLGSMNTMINDAEKKIYKDFMASPIGRGQIALGYILSSLTIGFIMSMIVFVLGELYILSQGGTLISLMGALGVVGVSLLNIFCSVSMFYFINLFIRTSNAFGVLSTIVGTVVGFIMGIYIPLGILPGIIQTGIKLFPPSHTVTLFRQLFLEAPLAPLANVPIMNHLKEELSIIYKLNGAEIPLLTSILSIVGMGVAFFIASVLKLKFTKRK